MLVFTAGTSPVGNDDDARRVASRSSGAKFLAHGLFKDVYTLGHVVYKIARRSGPEAGSHSNIVSEAAWAAKGHMEGVDGIPNVSVYVIDGVPVAAMPFFPESGDDTYQEGDERAETLRRLDSWYTLGLTDLHGENYRFDEDGQAWVTDLGGWGHTPVGVTLPDTLTSLRDENDGSGHCDCGNCEDAASGDEYDDYDDEDDDEDDDDDESDGPFFDDWRGEGEGVSPVVESARLMVGFTGKFYAQGPIRDLCGLGTRMGLRTQKYGFKKGAQPTCGHESRHPSRKLVSGGRVAVDQQRLGLA